MTSPAYAQSSLSHCSTERFGIRAHSTGHTSPTGRSQITMPPEWMPRCLGIFCMRSASAMTGSGTPASGGTGCPAAYERGPTCLDQAFCCSGEYPSARPASRIAIRGRYAITLATCAALPRP